MIEINPMHIMSMYPRSVVKDGGGAVRMLADDVDLVDDESCEPTFTEALTKLEPQPTFMI